MKRRQFRAAPFVTPLFTAAQGEENDAFNRVMIPRTRQQDKFKKSVYDPAKVQGRGFPPQDLPERLKYLSNPKLKRRLGAKAPPRYVPVVDEEEETLDDRLTFGRVISTIPQPPSTIHFRCFDGDFRTTIDENIDALWIKRKKPFARMGANTQQMLLEDTLEASLRAFPAPRKRNADVRKKMEEDALRKRWGKKSGKKGEDEIRQLPFVPVERRTAAPLASAPEVWRGADDASTTTSEFNRMMAQLHWEDMTVQKIMERAHSLKGEGRRIRKKVRSQGYVSREAPPWHRDILCAWSQFHGFVVPKLQTLPEEMRRRKVMADSNWALGALRAKAARGELEPPPPPPPPPEDEEGVIPGEAPQGPSEGEGGERGAPDGRELEEGAPPEGLPEGGAPEDFDGLAAPEDESIPAPPVNTPLPPEESDLSEEEGEAKKTVEGGGEERAEGGGEEREEGEGEEVVKEEGEGIKEKEGGEGEGEGGGEGGGEEVELTAREETKAEEPPPGGEEPVGVTEGEVNVEETGKEGEEEVEAPPPPPPPPEVRVTFEEGEPAAVIEEEELSQEWVENANAGVQNDNAVETSAAEINYKQLEDEKIPLSKFRRESGAGKESGSRRNSRDRFNFKVGDFSASLESDGEMQILMDAILANADREPKRETTPDAAAAATTDDAPAAAAAEAAHSQIQGADHRETAVEREISTHVNWVVGLVESKETKTFETKKAPRLKNRGDIMERLKQPLSSTNTLNVKKDQHSSQQLNLNKSQVKKHHKVRKRYAHAPQKVHSGSSTLLSESPDCREPPVKSTDASVRGGTADGAEPHNDAVGSDDEEDESQNKISKMRHRRHKIHHHEPRHLHLVTGASVNKLTHPNSREEELVDSKTTLTTPHDENTNMIKAMISEIEHKLPVESRSIQKLSKHHHRRHKDETGSIELIGTGSRMLNGSTFTSDEHLRVAKSLTGFSMNESLGGAELKTEIREDPSATHVGRKKKLHRTKSKEKHAAAKSKGKAKMARQPVPETFVLDEIRSSIEKDNVNKNAKRSDIEVKGSKFLGDLPGNVSSARGEVEMGDLLRQELLIRDHWRQSAPSATKEDTNKTHDWRKGYSSFSGPSRRAHKSGGPKGASGTRKKSFIS